MNEPYAEIPPGYSLPVTAAWFATGAVVTAVFSGSLAVLAKHAGLTEVLITGMIVPSFTWAVQLSASAIGLSATQRRLYWGNLGRVCLLGSVALLPAAVLNLAWPQPPLWLSAVNVLLSVALMGTDLIRRSAKHGIAIGWPMSWCVTIAANMGIFVWCSRGWW